MMNPWSLNPSSNMLHLIPLNPNPKPYTPNPNLINT